MAEHERTTLMRLKRCNLKPMHYRWVHEMTRHRPDYELSEGQHRFLDNLEREYAKELAAQASFVEMRQHAR